jgi:hypothetical protein
MTFPRFFSLTAWCALSVSAAALDLQNEHLMLSVADRGGSVTALTVLSTGKSIAGPVGLVQEGFGIGNPYVPNRRLNERLEAVEEPGGRALRYTYDCDGPNIKGLRITRIMELPRGEVSLRVTWRVENTGESDLWVAPWVWCEGIPGGAFSPASLITVPAIEGMVRTQDTRYLPVARNWAAVVNPTARESFYGVFDAGALHSVLTLFSAERKRSGFQAAFVPFSIKPGAAWETVYRLNIARGLPRVDFASDEMAGQILCEDGYFRVLFAGARDQAGLVLDGRLRGPDTTVWKLDGRRFDLSTAHVVRASHPWTAPFDGAYEYLARITGPSGILELGQDTASPHGGVDTMFSTTDGEPFYMAPWTDAVYRLNRGERKLTRALFPVTGAAVWAESSLDKVYPDDVPVSAGVAGPVKIALAGGERESFQIALRPDAGRNLHDVMVRAEALEGPGGASIPASDITLHRVDTVPVLVPSHFENPTGPCPDPLPPLHEPFDAPGGETMCVWVTVRAREGLAPGVYAGAVTVAGPDLEPVRVPVEATVFGFSLPRRPALKTDFGFRPDLALETCTGAGYTGERDNLMAAYLKNALEHRVTLRPLAALPGAGPDFPAGLADFEASAGVMKEAGVTTVAAPPSLLDTPDQLRQAVAAVTRGELGGMAFSPLASSPPRQEWDAMMARLRAWKAAAPDIPAMVTTFGLSPFLPEELDIWGIHLPMLDTVNNKVLLDRLQAGGEVWWYVNHEPAKPYGNFFVDQTGMDHRILFWQAWALQIRGFHYAGINNAPPGANPLDGLVDDTPVNGNGFLVYPGPGGPVSSVRWEIIRDGIEDYDYLTLHRALEKELEARGGDADLLAQAREAGNLKALVPDLVSYPRDAAALLEKRLALGRSIEAMHRATR